jgi:outer membrane protein assembly factor BamB
MLALGGLLALCGCDRVVGAAEQEPSQAVERDWPSFRGRFARGVADGFEVPLDWDLAAGRNVLWRTALPGLAASSPVVVGGRLFVTDAVPVDSAGDATGEEPVFRLEQDGSDRRGYGWIRSLEQEGEQRFEVVCLDKTDGRVLWRRTAHQGAPHSKRHPKGTHANPTPAADAHRVVAFFGAEGVHCFDHDGEHLWRRDLGKLVGGYYVNPGIQWGVGSSPVLHEDRVYLQCDVLDQAFLIALDARTGETVWRAERADAPGWGTPPVDVGADRRQVIVNGYEHLGGYDLDTGEILWSMVGGGAVPIPTPVVAGGLIYLTSSGGMPGGKGPQSQRSPIYAIPTGAVGELDVERPVSWADTERDLSAWLGNPMQREAHRALYELGPRVRRAAAQGAPELLRHWRKLTTSDHVYYMATKHHSDAEVHEYFSPYESPYDAFMVFMNVLEDLALRVREVLETTAGGEST